MAIFSDTFDRANGPLGGNWQVSDARFAILSGMATPQANIYAYAWDTTISELGRHEASATLNHNASGSDYSGVLVKMDGVSGHGYMAGLVYTGGVYYLDIRRGTSYSATQIAYVPMDAAPPGVYTVSLIWENGHLTATITGGYSCEVDDGTYAGGTYMGMTAYGTVSGVMSVMFVGGAALGLSADPYIVGNYGSCTDIDLTGVGTAWTPGTPGSPTFTVDHGTISAQTVHTATTATVTYCPGNYLGVATITDPSSGQTVQITVTSDPEIVPPSGDCCGISRAAVAMLNNTAGDSLVEVLTKPNTPITVDAGAELELETVLGRVGLTTGAKVAPAGVPDAGILEVLWTLVNGRYDPIVGPFPSPNFTTVDAGLYQIWTIVNTMSQGNTLTLQTILDAIGGGGASIQDVLDAIGTSWFDPDFTVHDDLDYLDNRSDHSLDQIMTRLGNMWGTDHWSLSQIVGAATDPQIESFASLHNIYARLQAMRGDTESTIANAEDWANLANTNASGAHSAINAWRTGSLYTAQDILNAIAAITIPPIDTTWQGAPVWPGADKATVYAPYDLTDGLTIVGPLHGLLFTITGQPAGAGRYRFGTHNSWTKCGAVIFTSDRGDHERAQQFGLDAHVVCPKEMRFAERATLRLNTGWTGTVRRFLID